MSISATLLAFLILVAMQQRPAANAKSEGRTAAADLRAVTLAKDTVPLWSDRHAKTVVVFINPYCCTSCNGPVGEMLSELEIDTATCDVVLLFRSASSLSRRSMRDKTLGYYPTSPRVLFDLQTAPDPAVASRVKEGAFGAFGIVHTPALLVWDNRKRSVIVKAEYQKLFNAERMSIAGGMRKKIREGIKN